MGEKITLIYLKFVKKKIKTVEDIEIYHCIPVSYTHLDVYKRQVVDVTAEEDVDKRIQIVKNRLAYEQDALVFCKLSLIHI